MTVRQISRGDYYIRMDQLQVNNELAWYATEDNRAIGVVMEDRADHDFSWVVLTENDKGAGFTATDINVSIPTEEEATAQLHAALLAIP
jgi:hypothetical protein